LHTPAASEIPMHVTVAEGTGIWERLADVAASM
jgi:hypothetical protein